MWVLRWVARVECGDSTSGGGILDLHVHMYVHLGPTVYQCFKGKVSRVWEGLDSLGAVRHHMKSLWPCFNSFQVYFRVLTGLHLT